MPSKTPARTRLSRRTLLGQGAGAGALLAASTVGAPYLAFGRHRLFAQSEERYSTRTVDLVGDSLVIDMLSPLTLASA